MSVIDFLPRVFQLRVCSRIAVLEDEVRFSSRFRLDRRRQYRDDDMAKTIQLKDAEKIPQITKHEFVNTLLASSPLEYN